MQDMAVIQDFDDPQDAWNGYKKLHKLHPTRELYVFYNSRRVIACFFDPNNKTKTPFPYDLRKEGLMLETKSLVPQA